jgi:protein-S-isoprenylcysteine O-methyltransferase Ste14
MSRLPSLGSRGEGWLALQLVLMAAIVGSSLIFEPFVSGAARVLLGALGVSLLVVGLGLVVLGSRRLGRGATPFPRPQPGAELAADGVYRRVRHPIYVGVIVSALGWTLVTASLSALVLVGLLAVLLDLKARREERWLDEHYPGYADYRRRTRRFIPRLY